MQQLEVPLARKASQSLRVFRGSSSLQLADPDPTAGSVSPPNGRPPTGRPQSVFASSVSTSAAACKQSALRGLALDTGADERYPDVFVDDVQSPQDQQMFVLKDQEPDASMTAEALSEATYVPHAAIHEAISDEEEASLDDRQDSFSETDYEGSDVDSETKYPLSVELKPFKNKAGGHTAIFQFSHRAVCKILQNRENTFYETVEKYHKDLLAFMPKYIGVLNVRHTVLCGGKCNQLRNPNKQNELERFSEVLLNDNMHILPHSMQRECRMQKLNPSGSFNLSEERPSLMTWSSDHSGVHAKADPKESHPSTRASSGGKNPKNNARESGDVHRVAKEKSPSGKGELNSGYTSVNNDLRDLIWKEVITRDRRRQHHSPFERRDSYGCEHADDCDASPVPSVYSVTERFILLEDLTHNRKLPCVLDLKMGTRQYGVDASIRKQKSQQSKCRSTTSLRYGVRICGMKIRSSQSPETFFRDKYFGRRIRGIRQFDFCLMRFLYDGTAWSVVKHVAKLERRLAQLAAIMKSLKDYRLYGASLLLVYDQAEQSKTDISIRLIDFAQSITSEKFPEFAAAPPSHRGEPDPGFLLGLTTLRASFKSIYKTLTRAEYSPEHAASLKMCDYLSEIPEFATFDASLQQLPEDDNEDFDDDDDNCSFRSF